MLIHSMSEFSDIILGALDLARRHEPHMRDVFVAGWTAARPALPLITALTTPPDLLQALRTAAQTEMDAIVLAS